MGQLEIIEEKNKVEMAVARLAGAMKQHAAEEKDNAPIFVLVCSAHSSSQMWLSVEPGAFETGANHVMAILQNARQYGVTRPSGNEPMQ